MESYRQSVVRSFDGRPADLYSFVMTGVVTGARSKLGRLTFRRAARTTPLDTVQHAIRGPSGKKRLSESAAYRVPHNVWRQYGESHCKRFEGATSRAALRDLDTYDGLAIRFRSEDFAEFDPFRLEFCTATGTTRLPCVDATCPRENDLLCGVVAKTKNGLVFTKWRPVSEQFFRMYTLCMYWEHSTFKAALKKKSGATAYWFGGNRLVNGYAKYMKRDDDHKEAHERFWNVTSEQLDHLHIYPAIVQVVRYGGTPFCAAVPRSKDAQNECASWDLPTPDWANMFARHHGIWTEEPVLSGRQSDCRPVPLLERETKGKYAVFSPGRFVTLEGDTSPDTRVVFVPFDSAAEWPGFNEQGEDFLREVQTLLSVAAELAPLSKPALARTSTELAMEKALTNGLWCDQ